MASEIEAQTVRWIAEMVGYSVHCGGLFLSSGNMANLSASLQRGRQRLVADAAIVDANEAEALQWIGEHERIAGSKTDLLGTSAKIF